MDRDEAAQLIARACRGDVRLFRDDPHFQRRLAERHLTIADALNALRYGRIQRDPEEVDNSDDQDEWEAACYWIRVQGRSLDGSDILVVVMTNPLSDCILWTIVRR